jgi:hypothetical protein
MTTLLLKDKEENETKSSVFYRPLNFWFNNNYTSALPIYLPDTRYDNRFCECCGDEVQELAKLPLEKLILNAPNKGMKNIVQSIKIYQLDQPALDLIEWCVDFLLWQEEKRDEFLYNRSKLVSLDEFIRTYLKIPDNGYNYWLMCFMEWNNIIDHGSGIRCAWLNNTDKEHFYKNRILLPRRRNIINKWFMDM